MALPPKYDTPSPPLCKIQISILINYLRSNEDGAYKDYALGKSDPVVERIINLIPELLEAVPQDVAHLRPGMQAVVKLSAYDYLIYGTLKGINTSK